MQEASSEDRRCVRANNATPRAHSGSDAVAVLYQGARAVPEP
jgi:hypothetical protein